jgi:hypothetical protein
VCGRTRRFDKNRGAIFGRRGLAAAVRSEAEDERPSPAAINPTLSATSFPFVLIGLTDRTPNVLPNRLTNPRGAKKARQFTGSAEWR